jgi:hypothetical protein
MTVTTDMRAVQKSLSVSDWLNAACPGRQERQAQAQLNLDAGRGVQPLSKSPWQQRFLG